MLNCKKKHGFLASHSKLDYASASSFGEIGVLMAFFQSSFWGLGPKQQNSRIYFENSKVKLKKLPIKRGRL